MIASKRSIKKAQALGRGVSLKPNEAVKAAMELGYDINPAYVFERPARKKLTKLQKKRKNFKIAKASHMYNLIHR